MQGKSKKAFSKNVETEMAHGKPQDQSIAIAYNVKRKNKRKKMAEGGMAYKNDSAKTESRPMPSERDNDAKSVSHNSGNKPAHNDSWTDNSTITQAQKPSKTPLARPALRGSDAFSVRYRDEIDEDNNRMTSMPPESDKALPPSRDNEEGPNRQGPKVSDMASEHSNGKMPYNKAIEDQYAEDMAAAEMKKTQSYANGGVVSFKASEDYMAEHPAGLESDNDMMGDEDAMLDHFADGGIAESVMKRRYAEDGQVDLDANAEEGPADLEDLNADAAMKENYSESEGLEDLTSPEDSNEHGHDLPDEDSHDMVETIRRRRFNKAK